MTPPIRVLLAEDDTMVRDALTGLLEREPDIDVVAAVGDGQRAIEMALMQHPDVAILDLQMPELDGLNVIAELGRRLPSCAGVILTSHGRPYLLRQALSSGARGFLAKGAPGAALIEAVRRVHRGQRYVDPLLAAEALTTPPTPLTRRETEVLLAARADAPIREMARALFLSQGTVRNYLAAIKVKLGAKSRADAYQIARENGWL